MSFQKVQGSLLAFPRNDDGPVLYPLGVTAPINEPKRIACRGIFPRLPLDVTFEHHVPIVRMNQLNERLGFQLLPRVAEEILCFLPHQKNSNSLPGSTMIASRGVFHHGAIACFADTQRRFVALRSVISWT